MERRTITGQVEPFFAGMEKIESMAKRAVGKFSISPFDLASWRMGQRIEVYTMFVISSVVVVAVTGFQFMFCMLTLCAATLSNIYVL